MQKAVRLLFFMGWEEEIKKIVHSIEQSGIRVSHKAVYDFASFCSLLKDDEWDIGFFECRSESMPSQELLADVRRLGGTVPLIAIMEEADLHRSSQIIKDGFQNYVIKGDCDRIIKITRQVLQAGTVKNMGDYTCENLYAALSAVSYGVISIDTEKRIVFINQAAQRLTGWNEDQAIGQILEEVFKIADAKTRRRFEFPYKFWTYDCRETGINEGPMLITKSGSEVFISVDWMPVKGTEGQASGVVITFHDITDYVQVHEKLRTERNNFKAQFRYAPVGMAIVNESIVLHSANDCFIDMCKDQNKSIIGKTLGEALGCINSLDRPCGEGEECSKCIIRASIIQVAKTRIPFRNAEKCFALLQNDRTIFRYLRFNLVPLIIEGRMNILISVDDMTEYRIMEDRIRKSRDFYTTLFEEFPALIWRTDNHKSVDYVNKRWLDYTGRTIQQQQERKWLEDIHPDDVSECEKLFRDAFDNRETFKYQCRMKRFDGEYRWFHGYASPYFDLGGSFAGYIGINHDITEQKQVELAMHRAVEAAKEAYNTKSEFLANMSHEIRTPLNGILGMIDLTLLTDLTEEQRDNLLTAKTCADALLSIISDVLDFSKMEAGKLNIEHMEFKFTSLIEDTVKVHWHHAKERGIDLTWVLPIGLPDSLVGDPNRLQQVLHNLLSNAVKFTDRGYVRLNIDKVSHTAQLIKLRFSVADTGVGISEVEMGKLFKSFSQIDGSRTRRHGGTGLGLVISKRLIEMMGGTMEVESEKGKGSTFSFTLEFKVGECSNSIDDGIKPGTFKTEKTGARVLIVEDDKVNQQVVERMLNKMGYKTDVADCGQDALKLLEQKSYDLCLMDIQMPGLDGVQTAAIIRKNEQETGRRLPIVAMTAYALKGDRERFLTMGMDEYIAKPFKMAELTALLERLLSEKDKVFNSEFSADTHTALNELDFYIRNYTKEIKPTMDEIFSSIKRLKREIRTGDMVRAEEVANNVKKLASSFGADRVKTLAFRVQLAARRGDRTEADRLLRGLAETMNKHMVNMERTGGEG